MAMKTVAEILELNDKNAGDEGASDVVQVANFLRVLPAKQSSHGTTHKWLKKTAGPVVGFRAANVGTEVTTGNKTIVSADLKILGGVIEADIALAKVFKNGKEGLIQSETADNLEAGLFAYEKQIFNGTVGGDDQGFVGFADTLDTTDNPQVVDAGGTAANTGSSVYACRLGPAGVMAVAAGAYEQGAVSEYSIPDPADEAGTKKIPVIGTNVTAYVGLEVSDNSSVFRLANLTEEVGHTLTDDLLAGLLSKAPSNRPVTHFAMNRRSLEQLRRSRTATNAIGAPAPTPTESNGVPIIVVESIGNDEAIISD